MVGVTHLRFLGYLAHAVAGSLSLTARGECDAAEMWIPVLVQQNFGGELSRGVRAPLLVVMQQYPAPPALKPGTRQKGTSWNLVMTIFVT